MPSSVMSDGSQVQKVDILNQFKLVRDAPTIDIYEERKAKLMEITEGLVVKPGNTKKSVLFHMCFISPIFPQKLGF